MAEIDHEIFRIFRNNTQFENKVVRNIIDVKNGIFYLFDVTAGDILVTNSASLSGVWSFRERYQVFEPRIRVFGNVMGMRASEDSIRVAVFTDIGLYIVDLPHIWTCLLLPPTCMKSTSCDVWMVPPEVDRMHRVFVYEVLQVRWHPRQHNYLLALYNDNFLRLLDTETHTLVQALSLGRHPNSSFSTVNALHEHTVDFDFDPASIKVEELTNKEEISLFVLSGTGDISHAVISTERTVLDEPMSIMMDEKANPQMANMIASSLIVLPCNPLVFIISSKLGVVFHCVLLQDGIRQYLKVFEDYDLRSVIKKKDTEPNLLVKDSDSNYRYFVLHAAGVFAVMLALIPVLEHLLGQHEEDVGKKLKAAVGETESVLRHLVNTSVPSLSGPRPPYGVGVIPVRVTMPKLLVLLADGGPLIHSMDSMFPPVTDYINKSISATKEPRKQFSAVISNYLLGSKSLRSPLLKVGEALKNASPEETLQFLRTSFNNLKEDRFRKHIVVAELIDAKVRDNTIELDCQLKQLEMLKCAKESLQQNAERIAEQYEETNDKNMIIQKRLERVSLRVSAPGRAVAEERLRTELLALKDKADRLEFSLLQTQALFEHRKRQEQQPNTQEVLKNPLYLNEQRKTEIRQYLVTMRENIREMKERIDRLKYK